MATETYEVVNDQTGEVFEVQGDRPPTQDEVRQLITSMPDFPGQEGIASTVVDVATTLGTGIAGLGAEMGGRLVGLGVGALSDDETATAASSKALEFGEAAREAIATEPTTAGGQKFMEGLGFLVEEAKGLADLTGAGLSGAAQFIGNLASGNSFDESISAAAQEIEKTREQGLAPTLRENVFEATGSPAAAALVGAVPETALITAGGVKTPSKLQGKIRASTSPAGTVTKPSTNLGKDVRVASRGTLPRDRSANIAAKAEGDIAAAAAFEELGIRPTPDLIATDAEFINLTNSVRDRVGSQLSKDRARVIQEVSTKADELIVSVGGKTDRSAVAADVAAEFETTINTIKAEEAIVWKPIREVPSSGAVRVTDDLVGYVDSRLADAKGSRAKLSPMDKEIFDLVYERVPTARKDVNGRTIYNNVRVDTTNALLNRTRSKTGRAGGKLDPIYPDSSGREIGQAYTALAKEQKVIMDAAGLGDEFKLANSLTTKRKALEESSRKLFGKKLDKGLIPKIDSAANAVVGGNVQPLRNLLREAPEASRAQIAANVLDSIIQSPGRGVKGTFVDRFKGLMQNKQAMNELFRNFPPEARKVFENIGIVSERLSLNPTIKGSSVVQSSIADGAVAKVLHAERAIPFAGRAIQGASENITKVFTNSEKSLKAADAFLSSPEFVNAIKAQAAGNAARANNIVGSSPKYQKWLANLDSTLRSRIVKEGFVTWLLSEETQ